MLFFLKQSKVVKKSILKFVSDFIPEKSWEIINLFGPEIEYGGKKFSVDPDFSLCENLYLIGDCIGIFRGVFQAFTSGYVCGRQIGSKNYA